MVGRWSLHGNCAAMRQRGVALVHGPIEARLFGVQGAHHFIAVRFCQYTGSCDTSEFSVPLDHALMRNAEVRREAVAIDKEQVRS